MLSFVRGRLPCRRQNKEINNQPLTTGPSPMLLAGGTSVIYVTASRLPRQRGRVHNGCPARIGPRRGRVSISCVTWESTKAHALTLRFLPRPHVALACSSLAGGTFKLTTLLKSYIKASLGYISTSE